MKKVVAGGFIRRMDHVVWKVVDGKGILLNLEDGSYFDVDSVGLEVWKLCDGRKKINEIVIKISSLFKADPKKVDNDVRKFANELKRRKLIEMVTSPASALTRS